MRYGKKPTGGMWLMTVQLRTPPLCPGCCEELQGVVVEIRHSWAWCPICAASLLPRDKVIRYVLATSAFRELSTTQHGLRFYTPRCATAQAKTAFSFLADTDLPEVPLPVVGDDPVVAVRLPGGVCDMTKLLAGLRELGAMVDEMKAIRDRKRGPVTPPAHQTEMGLCTAHQAESLPPGGKSSARQQTETG